MNISSFSFTLFFVLLLALAPKTHSLKSCSATLEPIFTGAQGHHCIQLTITTASASTSTVANAQGNIYFNHYFNSLVNQDTPSFGMVSSLNMGCNHGLAQPFSAKQVLLHMAKNVFNVLVTCQGMLRMAVGSQVFQNMTLGCNNGTLPTMGFDQSSNVYTTQFKLFKLSDGYPTNVVSSLC